MQHLNEEQLVLHHYHDDESPAAVEQHLASCDACRGEFSALRRVLALVDELPVPEAAENYGTQVWNRVRWKLDRRRRTTWQSVLAAAAIVAMAFFAGQLWHRRGASALLPATGVARNIAEVSGAAQARERVLVVVVADHLDNSERMLLEVANADAKRELNMSEESKRAAELVATNRMYRQVAAREGDSRIAALLADLEPVLVELSHADKLSPEEVASLQKRIDSKGLLFKVRVVSAETSGRELPAVQKGTNSL